MSFEERRNKIETFVQEIYDNAIARGGVRKGPDINSWIANAAGGAAEYLIVARTSEKLLAFLRGEDVGEIAEGQEDMNALLREHLSMSMGENEQPAYPKPRDQWREVEEGEPDDDTTRARTLANRRQGKWQSFLKKILAPTFAPSDNHNTLAWHLNREQCMRLISELIGEVQTMRNLRVDMVCGDSILAAYREKQMGSCMGGPNPQFGGVASLQYYVNHPDIVRVLTVRGKGGDLLARRLIWRGVNQKNEVVYFLDRMYPDARGGTNDNIIRNLVQAQGMKIEDGIRTVTAAQDSYPSIDCVNIRLGRKTVNNVTYQVVANTQGVNRAGGTESLYAGPGNMSRMNGPEFNQQEIDRIQAILDAEERPFGLPRTEEGASNRLDRRLETKQADDGEKAAEQATNKNKAVNPTQAPHGAQQVAAAIHLAQA